MGKYSEAVRRKMRTRYTDAKEYRTNEGPDGEENDREAIREGAEQAMRRRYVDVQKRRQR